MGERALEQTLTRDRAIVLGGLFGILALAWAYLVYMGWSMEHMDVAAEMAIMPRMTDWGAFDLLLVFAMWAIMMAAMMLPSATPMVVIFATLSRRRREQQQPFVPTSAFVLGYLAVWMGFSLVATLIQWGLLEARLVTRMMEGASPLLGGGLLVAAGLFQFTPLKRACLAKCGSPLSFIITQWREGIGGAFVMGLRHGTYCTGCCWLMMALLFVFGVMNLLWIAVLSAFVLLEKLLTDGRPLRPASGALLILWGAMLITRGI